MELGCFAGAGTADFVLFRDDVVVERTEPGKQHYNKYTRIQNNTDITDRNRVLVLKQILKNFHPLKHMKIPSPPSTEADLNV